MNDELGAAEERIASERIRRKLEEVNLAAQQNLSPVQDHVNFTLQQAYFKCAYECFDRRRRQDEISSCVEFCSVPVVSAQQRVENEMAKFQEKLNRALMVCQDKFETAKSRSPKMMKGGNNHLISDLEACVDHSINDSISTLPHLAHNLMSSMSIPNNN